MGIDFYDKWVEDEIKDRVRIGGDMYDHREDYIKRDKYNKLDEKFEKAKEIIKDLCGMVRELNKPNVQLTNVDYSLSEAEQFIKE